MLKFKNRKSAPFLGSQFYRTDAPNAIWEVLAIFSGADGKSHAVLFNLSDPTCRKTVSAMELEDGCQYRLLQAN
jgi:hypothetical protein